MSFMTFMETHTCRHTVITVCMYYTHCINARHHTILVCKMRYFAYTLKRAKKFEVEQVLHPSAAVSLLFQLLVCLSATKYACRSLGRYNPLDSCRAQHSHRTDNFQTAYTSTSAKEPPLQRSQQVHVRSSRHV